MKKIFVVDDDDDIRHLEMTLLKMKGYNVEGFASLDPYHLTKVPDLFILDFLLAGESGKDICEALKQNSETMNIPIIMVSALADVKSDCMSAGATAFITKPFSIKDFIYCVKKVLSENELAKN